MIAGMESVIPLSQYIGQLSIPRFCEQYAVKERTAASWYYGERLPSRRTAQALVLRSGGELSMAMIYAPPPAAAGSEAA
jgi:hypothetical protein